MLYSRILVKIRYTVKFDLKTIFIKRPPVLRDHLQVLPRFTTITLTCIKRPLSLKTRDHFLPHNFVIKRQLFLSDLVIIIITTCMPCISKLIYFIDYLIGFKLRNLPLYYLAMSGQINQYLSDINIHRVYLIGPKNRPEPAK